MTKAFAILLLIVASMSQYASAQPIARPVRSNLSVTDTSASIFLPDFSTAPAGSHGALHTNAQGHMIAADGTEIRLFGTELYYTANFIPRDAATILAGRLQKLGFNAIRLRNFDYWGWEAASLFRVYDDAGKVTTSSYVVNPAQFARFDTLLYELKQRGIYSVLPINSVHNFLPQELQSMGDSSYWANYLLRFLYPSAAGLEHKWAKTFLSHVNPLTGLSIASDPSVAVIEMTDQTSLYWYWTLNRLNFIDSANAINVGLATVGYKQSERLDTLFSSYLKTKYGNDAALNAAWRGPIVSNPPNLIENGNFEDLNSAAWSLQTSNGAKATNSLFSPAKDSGFSQFIHIADLGPNPALGNIFYLNTSARLAMDSLYELKFWARVRYDANASPIRNRQIYTGVVGVSGGTSYAAYIDVDTNWKEYVLPFRSKSQGLSYVILYMGLEKGDVLLDGFRITRKEETGLYPGESLANSTVVRITLAQAPAVSIPRVKDLMMFYDKLQSDYYTSMQKLIKDTLQYKGLVNFSQSGYWARNPDHYAQSGGDVTEAVTGWDYMRGRNNAYTDSLWTIGNTPLLPERSGYLLGLINSASVKGKAFMLGTFSTPFPNQYTAATALFIPAYAAFHDWQGIFFGPYALYNTELFNDRYTPSQYRLDIVSNHTLMAMMPTASMIFREGLVIPSVDSITVKNDANDVFLAPLYNRGFYGVDGYFDPNAGTQFRIRQSYNATSHTVAAEYPYVPDTSVKRSYDGQITWDQTNGMFYVNTPKVQAVSGFVGGDTIRFPDMLVRRDDNTRELLTVSYIPLDDSTLAKSAKKLLTIVTRTQNEGVKWVDSLGWSNTPGEGPGIMSAAKVTIALRDTAKQFIQPLDSMGQPYGLRIFGEKRGGWQYFQIDQMAAPSMWFGVGDQPASVATTNAESGASLRILSNPVITGIAQLELSIPSNITGELAIFDALARIVWSANESNFVAGKNLFAPQLRSGSYTALFTTQNYSIREAITVVR